MKRDGLFDDVPIWFWFVWVVVGLFGLVMSGAVIWLIFTVAEYLSSH